MSHAEIWDDSALVDSWNDALEEYKVVIEHFWGETAAYDPQRYHSVHAQGEKIAQVAESAAFPESNEVSRVDSNDMKHSPVKVTESGRPGNSTDWEEVGIDLQQPRLPQHLIGSVQDEGLKNLLMSWYYAGYYTGLHEGQQKMGGK